MSVQGESTVEAELEEADRADRLVELLVDLSKSLEALDVDEHRIYVPDRLTGSRTESGTRVASDMAFDQSEPGTYEGVARHSDRTKVVVGEGYRQERDMPPEQELDRQTPDHVHVHYLH